jgi:cyclopropane-fatty-acyl-phospholipid synthase
MLYKFKSKATGDLIMLEPQGRQVLNIIGKEAGAKGIIEPEEMLAAIQALREAVQAEEDASKEAKSTDEDVPKVDGNRTISLKQRVVPFIDMLQRAHAEDKDIVWGV